MQVKPLIICECTNNSQHKRPSMDKGVSITVKDLKDRIQLFLSDIWMGDGGQLLEGGQNGWLKFLKYE